MKKVKILGCVLLGGALYKILKNQERIDRHIYEKGVYGIDRDDLIDENTTTRKIEKFIYKHLHKEG